MGTRTYRVVDGERIEGTVRPIFIRNAGMYFLTELLIFADGLIDCWGPVTLDGLRGKVESGWVATELPVGGRASAHHLATWTFAEATVHVSPADLLGEVADEIERLAGRPTSADRCRQAVREFREQPDERHRDALGEAYRAVPSHLRTYLGDMDNKDRPVRVLMTRVGADLDGRVVSKEQHRAALDYFAREDAGIQAWQRERDAQAAAEAALGPTTTVQQTVYPRGWPDPPGQEALRNEFPRPIRYRGREYASVHHAFCALSVADERRAAEIAATDNPFQARDAARDAPRTADWDSVRPSWRICCAPSSASILTSPTCWRGRETAGSTTRRRTTRSGAPTAPTAATGQAACSSSSAPSMPATEHRQAPTARRRAGSRGRSCCGDVSALPASSP